MLICGIDPGITGAYALVKIQNKTHQVLIVRDMPVTLGTGNKKFQIDGKKLYKSLKSDFETFDKPSYVNIEKQQPMPKQGVTSSFSIGQSFGIIQGVTEALETIFYFNTRIVTPQSWKRSLSIPKADERSSRKDHAKNKFYELISDYEPAQFNRVKDIDRMEACLIALYKTQPILGSYNG